MGSIAITADSGADLTKRDRLRLGVKVAPFHLTLASGHFDDGEMDVEDMLALCDESGKVPKTSACSPADYELLFRSVREEQPSAEILHLGYSAATTSSFEAACAAAAGQTGIACVDTKSATGAYGLIVGKVVEFVERNPSAGLQDAVAFADGLVRRIRMGFIPWDLRYLKAGGRLTNAEFLAAQLLNVKPVVEMVDGVLVATRKMRGSAAKVCRKFLDDFLGREKIADGQVVFLWSPGLDQKVRDLAEERAREHGIRKVSWVKTGCVVTSHCGAGTFGCALLAAE